MSDKDEKAFNVFAWVFVSIVFVIVALLCAWLIKHLWLAVF